MGTLTANCERLPGYCDHKLPTSCRLTSIPLCCACADERVHAASHSTYIDGIGFVPRGTRWQRYCWYCREFWEKRVHVSGLRPGQTKIPDVPDQREFLERWYEFHRGYRTVKHENGREERVSMVGEPFRNVDPGCLPRTVEEMRTGAMASQAASQPQQVGEEQTEHGERLEDTLDQMFQAAEQENRATAATSATAAARRVDTRPITAPAAPQPAIAELSANNIHAQAMNPTGSRSTAYQARLTSAYRREPHRMRNGIQRLISPSRDLGEQGPDHTEAANNPASLGRSFDAIDGTPSREVAERAISTANTLATRAGTSQTDRTMANIQSRVDEARQRLDEAKRNRDQAALELDSAELELRTSQRTVQRLRGEQRTAENYITLFGTREEMLAQADQYESPIGSMFTQAYARFRAAEEVRREERTLRGVLEDEACGGGEEQAQWLAELGALDRDVWGVPRQQLPQPQQQQQQNDGEEVVAEQEPRGELEEYYALLRRHDWRQEAPSAAAESPREMGMVAPISPLQEGGASGGEDANGDISGGVRLLRSTLNVNLAANERARLGHEAQVASNIAFNPPEDTQQPELEDWCHDSIALLSYVLEHEDVLEEQLPYNDVHSVSQSLIRIRARTPTDEDRELVNALVLHEEPKALWSSGIIGLRLSRPLDRGVVRPLGAFSGHQDVHRRFESVELMAEAFQMSAEVRRNAPGLTAPEQLRMLYRLQAGERVFADFLVLQEMVQSPEISLMASHIHAAGRASQQNEQTRHQIDDARRDAARQGDHSRGELDAQRRAAQAFAVAAGRTAMQTGARGLLEQMASRDEETRAAYERLRSNGWAPGGSTPDERLLRRTMYRPLSPADYELESDSASDSPSDSESDAEDREAQGLDAKDSGRPEPKTEEEMSISMECRICYTQVAEIACLPCGHLVMCKWCSDQHSPVMAHDHTRPSRAAGCPVCRMGIRQKVRVFRA